MRTVLVAAGLELPHRLHGANRKKTVAARDDYVLIKANPNNNQSMLKE